MFAKVTSHAPLGIEGELISVEVDLRRGIPGIDIVGLPDGAVKEARERVRVAVRNSGFDFPAARILVNLAPAGLKKAGAAYDLPIAIGILAASDQVPAGRICNTLILGELNLSGDVKPVNGVLSAVGSGIQAGIKLFLVPRQNLREARLLGTGKILGISSLKEAVQVLEGHENVGEHCSPGEDNLSDTRKTVKEQWGDLSDIKGHWILKRALEVAAAGKHHLFLFGAPGCGKTMAARRLPTILPELEREEALLVTRIHSIAGVLPPNAGLITRPPFRMPHHTASAEGIIGGGAVPRPGEVSLAHGGVLFLDEAPEFRQNLLQALREPVEEQMVTIARAAFTFRFPASFQLVLAANPCPCGNLGRGERACICSSSEVHRYWKRIGGALLDRVDIRVPLKPVPADEMTGETGITSREVKMRVQQATALQKERYRNLVFSSNARIPPGLLSEYCRLDHKCTGIFNKAINKLAISSRACHSILKIARTIADLAGAESIREDHLLEAVQHRRYGDNDLFWKFG